MTLVAAWVRNAGPGSEMVFASDSRLRQGGAWDTCPKVFRLPRSDALMAFAGETLWAYPIVLQTINDVEAFPPSRTRQSDLRVARGHALRVINEMLRSGDAIEGGYHVPETDFLIGGWSWEAQRFTLWRFHWSHHDRAYRHQTIRPTPFGLVAFIGDRNRKDPTRDLVAIARRDLWELLKGREKTSGPLDMEPFEVLVALLRSAQHDTIGGPPQLAKVYRHMNAEFMAVMWPSRDGLPTLAGRELLDYEQLDTPVIDPDDPARVISQVASRATAIRQAQAELLLSPAIEELGRVTVSGLADWSEEHAYQLTRRDIRRWVRAAVNQGVLRRSGKYVELVVRESAEEEEDGESWKDWEDLDAE
jgi:hypothetical protein